MSEWVCPFCGKVPSSPSDNTWCYTCEGCKRLVTRHDLPADFRQGRKESPTVILKDGGVGWVGKNGNRD